MCVMYDVYVNECVCVCVVCDVCGYWGVVWVYVCGICVVLCVRSVPMCVCVQINHQKPPHSGFLQFQYFLLCLYFCL